MKSLTKSRSAADRWMLQGIEENASAKVKWQEAKVHFLTAGVCFIRARESLVPGVRFDDFLQLYELNIGRRAAYSYIRFAELALEWAAAEHPEDKDNAPALLKRAKALVLQSPRAFTALLRELGELRKFGEYDSVRYQKKKLLGEGQFELDFGKLFSSLDALEHLGEADCTLLVPEGKDEREATAELVAKLETVLAKIRPEPVTAAGTGGDAEDFYAAWECGGSAEEEETAAGVPEQRTDLTDPAIADLLSAAPGVESGPQANGTEGHLTVPAPGAETGLLYCKLCGRHNFVRRAPHKAAPGGSTAPQCPGDFEPIGATTCLTCNFRASRACPDYTVINRHPWSGCGAWARMPSGPPVTLIANRQSAIANGQSIRQPQT